MNDLLLHIDSALAMYAEYSVWYATGGMVEDLDVQLNADMDFVNDCCHDNHMGGNRDKLIPG